MTSMNIDDLVRLRSMVHSGGPMAEDTPPAGTVVRVLRRDDGAINHVHVGLAVPAEINELASGFGPPRELPRLPTGGRRVVFPATQPNDGERSVTVIAELNRAGQVTAVVLRPDDFTAT